MIVYKQSFRGANRRRMKKMKLQVKIGKLVLDTPIVMASGTFGFGEELVGLANFKAIGAITTKTITLNPRAGNAPPRIYETEVGVLNSVGLENPGVDVFIKEKLPKIRKLPTKCIVSVGGFTQNEYKQVVNKIKNLECVDAIELNLSCPNLKLKKMVSQSSKETFSLVKEIRSETKKPLIVKITPEVTDIVEIAQSAKNAGVDAIALTNTFYGMAINIETRKPYLGNGYGGYSGKAIKPLSLYRVWKVAQALDLPLIAGGGIEIAQDAIEFFLAGAKAISIGTVNLIFPNQAEEIFIGIVNYLRRKKISSMEKIKMCCYGKKI